VNSNQLTALYWSPFTDTWAIARMKREWNPGGLAISPGIRIARFTGVMSTAVKICGITRIEDAQAAAGCGAHALGLVFYDKSPRAVSVAQARAIVDSVPPFVTLVGLFVDPEKTWVNDVIKALPLNLLQFHGDEPPEFCAQFGLPYIKALRVREQMDLLQYAVRYSGARGILLDAYVEGRHGGTGLAFDWYKVPKELHLPVILSGGLTPQNVGEAIRIVRPWAVDVSSGVEARKGVKDAQKIAAFMQRVRDADLRLA
jgi:phosphoribosylanthranilate isomerase